MTTNAQTGNRTLILALGAVVLLWILLGALDMRNSTYSGITTDGNNTITQIEPGSPAEAAGMQVGDYIVSSGGIASSDTRAQMARGRASVGETRAYVVRRGDEELELDLTFASQPARNQALTWVGFVTALVFLCFGLWGYLKADGKSAFLLAVVGLCFGFLIGGGPYFESMWLRRLQGVVTWVAIVGGFASLFHFTLEFPQRKAFLDRPKALWWVYGPGALIGAVFALFILIAPDSTSFVNRLLNLLVGLFAFGYFALSLVSLIQTYRKASAESRAMNGLNLAVIGCFLGLLPLTVSFLAGLFAPGSQLPGGDFYQVSLVLVPIALALAVVKSGRQAAAAA